MAENYYKNNRIYHFETDILSINKNDKGNFIVELDGTYFYPEGGGQPADRGTIDGIEVIDVQKIDNRVVHTLKREPANKIVSCEIEKRHRDVFMTQHTGQHLISAVLKRELDIDTLSVHLGEVETRIEIDRQSISEDEIDLLEDKVNDLIGTGKRVIYHETDDEGLKSFNIRRVSKYSGYIRVVEIEDYDSVPCGGVHLSNLYELGLIKVTGYEKIRGHIRLTFLIGRNALLEFRKLERVITKLNNSLSTTNDTIIEGFETLQKSITTLKLEKKDLSASYTKLLVEQLKSSPESFQVFENLPVSITGKVATELCGELDQPLLIINKHERVNWYLIDSRSEEVDFNKFRNDILPIINGKGGGKKAIWQGSGEILNLDNFLTEFISHLDNRKP